MVALVSAQIFAGFHNAAHAFMKSHVIEHEGHAHEQDNHDKKKIVEHDCQICVNTHQLLSGLNASPFLLNDTNPLSYTRHWQNVSVHDSTPCSAYRTRAPPHLS